MQAHPAPSAWRIALCEQLLGPRGHWGMKRYQALFGKVPSHTFLSLEPPGDSPPEQQIHGGPALMKGVRPAPTHRDSPDLLIADMIGLGRRGYWYKLLMTAPVHEHCEPDEAMTAKTILWEGAESTTRRRWNTALRQAAGINAHPQFYKMAGPNCNTATYWLCQAIGIDPPPRPHSHAMGFTRWIRPLVSPRLAGSFTTAATPDPDIATLKATTVAYGHLLDRDERLHRSPIFRTEDAPPTPLAPCRDVIFPSACRIV